MTWEPLRTALWLRCDSVVLGVVLPARQPRGLMLRIAPFYAALPLGATYSASIGTAVACERGMVRAKVCRYLATRLRADAKVSGEITKEQLAP